MLGEVVYRKATLEDWKDIERVSQVLNENIARIANAVQWHS